MSIEAQPNIVIVHADDIEKKDLGCYGGKRKTPHIDRLARAGMRFTRHYPVSSICTPSRYAFLTGRYPSRAKSLSPDNGEPAFIRWNTDIHEGDHCLGHIFSECGYATGFVGKWHNGFPELTHVPYFAECDDPEIQDALLKNYQTAQKHIRNCAGFETVEAAYLTNLSWLPLPRGLMHHNQHWLTHQAIDFIDAKQKQPFLLYLASTLPHSPNGYDSLKSDPQRTLRNCETAHLNAQPAYADVIKRAEAAGPFESKEEHDRYASLLWLDDAVGALIDKLEQTGEWENTIFIFTSDHEDWAKMTCNQGEIPLIISWPGKIEADSETDTLSSNIDIIPTLLELIKSPHPFKNNLDGCSLAPLLLGQNYKPQESIYLEVTYTRAVVTQDWKYIALRYPDSISQKITDDNRYEFNQEGTRYSVGDSDKIKVRYHSDKKFPGYYDFDQLYFIKEDPNEQKNLFGCSEHKAVENHMQVLLKDYCQRLPWAFGEFSKGISKSR